MYWIAEFFTTSFKIVNKDNINEKIINRFNVISFI